jgi:hypothetical protein
VVQVAWSCALASGEGSAEFRKRHPTEGVPASAAHELYFPVSD